MQHGVCFILSAALQHQNRKSEAFSASVLLIVILVTKKDLRRQEDFRKCSHTLAAAACLELLKIASYGSGP